MNYKEIPRLCVVCESELRLVPAGTSKTKVDPKTGQYKKYEAFWSCPNRCKVDNYKTSNTGSAILADRVSALEDKVEKMAKFLREKYNLEQ